MRGLTKTILIGLSIGVFAGVGYTVYKVIKNTKREEDLTMADIDDILKSLKAEKELQEKEHEEDSIFSVLYPDGTSVKLPKTIHTLTDDDFIDEEEEGEKQMKKGTDPNSKEAYVQYVNMVLADIINLKDRSTMERLFDFKFEPTTLADRALLENITDDRAAFFGESSKYSTQCSWADLIMHYVNKVHYNLGDSPDSFLNYLLTHIGVYPAMRDEDLIGVLYDLSYHTYTNNHTGFFGLFGLDDEGFENLQSSMEFAVEQKFTFEGEFNAFLGMAIGAE